MANIRQSRPVYGRVFLAKVLRFFKALPLCLEAVWKGVNRCPPGNEWFQPPSTPRAAPELHLEALRKLDSRKSTTQNDHYK